MKPEVKILAKNSQNHNFEQQKMFKTFEQQKMFKTEGLDTVYLDNGQYFEFQFFNPLDIKIAVSIEFNGTSKTSDKLVIKPGQTVTIDRFLETNNKMIFETYEVESGREGVAKAIKNNGDVIFRFYKEFIKPSYNQYSSNTRGSFTRGSFTLGNNIPSNGCFYNDNVNINDTYGQTSNVISNSATFRTACLDGMSICDTSNDNKKTIIAEEPAVNIDGDLNLTGNMTIDGKYVDFRSLLRNDPVMEETGRVEQGEVSDQEFAICHDEFQTYTFYKYEVKFNPLSKKPEPETERNYCTDCGLRIKKKNWTFCPKCGANVI